MQPQRARLVDEQPEDALAGRQVPDLLAHLIAQPDVGELHQAAVRPDHPDRRVPRPDQLDRGLQDPGQHLRQRQVAGHRHHRVQ
jgi:hypothetical protein